MEKCKAETTHSTEPVLLDDGSRLETLGLDRKDQEALRNA